MTFDQQTIDTEDAARRLGARAGLLNEGHPEGFDHWPGRRQAAFAEGFERGRHTRMAAEGKTDSGKTKPVPAPAAPTSPDELTLRAEFDRSPALQHEFIDFASFAAFRRAEAAGRFKLLRRV